MHYNELQSRSAEVEAMASNFQKMAADEVAKARLRAKQGPKKKGGTKDTTGRGKTKHKKIRRQKVKIQWRAAESNERKTKRIIYQRQWSCESQAASAIRSAISH
jgi:hypothetical protein